MMRVPLRMRRRANAPRPCSRERRTSIMSERSGIVGADLAAAELAAPLGLRRSPGLRAGLRFDRLLELRSRFMVSICSLANRNCTDTRVPMGAILSVAEAWMAEKATLEALRRRARSCTACELYRRATQTVFGQGPAGARLMFIGEQPGDREDLEGLPFVGPAGQLLDRALTLAGIDRHICYVTNAVKHFKWEPRGKRRLHKTPAQREIDACRQWLLGEIAALQPALLICLGATAAKAIFGPSFRVTRSRGQLLRSPLGALAMATVHPSAVLRSPGSEERERNYRAFVTDLSAARSVLPREARADPHTPDA